MIINNISLRNFKSYGNNLQTLNFNVESQLILVNAPNGMGKSSLLESIDFSIFNVVRGKNIKRLPANLLPNRYNKNLETEINFQNWSGDNIIINRKLGPKGFKIFVNEIDITEKYEKMTQKEKDHIIGVEYNTYKSLISLNLADFANFINLDIDTKRKLLNKLFDIDEMDEYLSMTREILKNHYKNKERLEFQILSNNNIISSYKENIEVISSKSLEMSNKINIKNEIIFLKEKYEFLKREIGDLKSSLHPILKNIKSNIVILTAQKDKIFKDEYELNDLFNKIEVFNSGQCHICGTRLDDKNHKLEHEKLNLKYESLSKDLLDFKQIYNNLKSETKEKNLQKIEISELIKSKENEFNSIRNNMILLKNQYDNIGIDSTSIIEIRKNIETIEESSENIRLELDFVNEKILKLEKISDILSEKGIRREIISTIVDPINDHLSSYLVDLESKYNVKLNGEFDAVIKERSIENIHVETLSTGEARKINIAIALSYMETILNMNKKTNVLFMDEVFASVDSENVNLILKILKKFSQRNNINVLIASPLDFDQKYFDRVIRIYKDMGFSQIEEV